MKHVFFRNLSLNSAALLLLVALLFIQFSPVAAEEFTINVGDEVTGTIEFEQDDIYSFALTAGQEIVIDTNPSDVPWLYWKLLNTTGGEITTRSFNNSIYQYTATTAGTYQMVVYMLYDDTGGSYTFRIRDTNSNFTINIGDEITPDPATGEGIINFSYQRDVYSFEVEAGQRLIFMWGDTLLFLTSQLENPNGEEVFSVNFTSGQQWIETLSVAGTYKLSVSPSSASPNEVGNYSFRIVEGIQKFTINMGDSVSPGVPADGAGRIGISDQWDEYSFTAQAGDRIIFEAGETLLFPIVKLFNSNDEEVFSRTFKNLYLAETLTIGGTYRLQISNSSTIGNYEFKLWNGRDTMAISIPTDVTPGSPTANAGTLETKAMIDVYTFPVAGSAGIFLDAKESSTDLEWKLVSPSGATIFENDFADQQLNLDETGDYRIEINSTFFDAAGTFSFTLSNLELEMVSNGGFEPDSTGWTGKNLVRDKVKCNKTKPDGTVKVVARSGQCAMIFAGSVGENSSISQSPDTAILAPGNTLTLRAWARGANTSRGSVIVKIQYTNPTSGSKGNGRDKMKLKFKTGSFAYETYDTNLTINDTITNLSLTVKHKATAGKLFVDDVSLKIGAAGERSASLGLPSQDNLLALPGSK
jgi:hypothetical protein